MFRYLIYIYRAGSTMLFGKEYNQDQLLTATDILENMKILNLIDDYKVKKTLNFTLKFGGAKDESTD